MVKSGDKCKIMFIGEYQHSIDPKRRIAIPVKFRSTFKGKAIITRGLDGCLFVYPTNTWEKLAHKLGSLPLGEKRMRQFVRLVLSQAIETEVDKQGRILIPNFLSTFANLKKEAVVAGLYDRLEIWDKNKWLKTSLEADKEKDVMAEELGKLGIY